MRIGPTRRGLISGAAAVLAASVAGGHAVAQPVAQRIRVLDMAVSHDFAEPTLEAFAGSPGGRLALMTMTSAPLSALAALGRQIKSGRPPFDVALVGVRGFSMGSVLDLWQPLDTGLDVKAAEQDSALTPLAQTLQHLAGDKGLVIRCGLGGPLLVYGPDKVPTVPRTPQDLLDWTRQNPRRFLYPRPPEATAGRLFISSLPALLGDRDPGDPVKGWDRTWDYLCALGQGIDYYPASTRASFDELAEQNCDLLATTIGWDIHARAQDLVPPDTKAAVFDGQSLFPVGGFLCVPRNVDPAKRPFLAAFAAFMRAPQQQAFASVGGALYPGSVSRDVTKAMMPAAARAWLDRFLRPETDTLLASHPVATPMPPERMQYVLQRWDEQVGACVANNAPARGSTGPI